MRICCGFVDAWRFFPKPAHIAETQDPRKIYWDFFVGTLIVYSMVVIPWRISFGQDASGAMLIFDYIVDGVFGIDIALAFNAAYYEEVQIDVHRTSYRPIDRFLWGILFIPCRQKLK